MSSCWTVKRYSEILLLLLCFLCFLNVFAIVFIYHGYGCNLRIIKNSDNVPSVFNHLPRSYVKIIDSQSDTFESAREADIAGEPKVANESNANAVINITAKKFIDPSKISQNEIFNPENSEKFRSRNGPFKPRPGMGRPIWGRPMEGAMVKNYTSKNSSRSDPDQLFDLKPGLPTVEELTGDNPHLYHYIINHPQRCGNFENVFLLLLVNSAPLHFEHREVIRHTWGRTRANGRIVCLFLLGQPGRKLTDFELTDLTDLETQFMIEEENSKNLDILQEDFLDTYRNLTLKTVMGMKWAHKFCSKAKYVMKLDDDMWLNTDRLLTLLEPPRENLWLGYVFDNTSKVRRNPQSKWFVPFSDYPYCCYPPYPAGTGYVMSRDIASRLYIESLKTKFFFIDDVYVGMLGMKMGIRPTGNGF